MHVSIHHCAHDCPVITVTGAMLAEECAGLRRVVDAAADTAPEVLLLDLHGVTAFDSSAVIELNHARKQMERRGGRMALLSPSTPVTTLLSRTRLDTVFPHVTHADSAADCCCSEAS